MTIAFVASGGFSAGSSGGAGPSMPAGVAAGHMLLLKLGMKPYSATMVCPAGWLRLDDGCGTNGTTANGIDTGSVKWEVFYREYQAGDVAPSIDLNSPNVSLSIIEAYSKTSAAWVIPVAVKGSDTSSGTALSLTMSANPGITSGDMLSNFAVIPGDNATFSLPTLTATDATIGTVTDESASTTNGNDLAAASSYASCTAGTATAAPVVGWTLSAAQTGGGCLVRLRETATTYTPPTGTDTITPIASSQFAYPLGFPFNTHLHFTGQHWKFFYYPGNGETTAIYAMYGDKDTGIFNCMAQPAIPSGGTSNITSYRHGSFGALRQTYGAAGTCIFNVGNIHVKDDDSNTLTDYTTPWAGGTLTGTLNTVVPQSLAVAANDYVWAAGYTASYASLRACRSTDPLVMTAFDAYTEIRAIAGGSSASQYIVYENNYATYANDVGILHSDTTSLYYKYHNSITPAWGASETIVTSGMAHVFGFRGTSTRERNAIVFWADATTSTTIKYSVRSSGAAGTWSTPATAVTNLTSGSIHAFSCTANLGSSDKVILYYHNGTDIVYRIVTVTSTSASFGSEVVLADAVTLRTPTAALQAPVSSVKKFGCAYTLSTGVMMLAVHTIEPVEVGTNGVLVSQNADTFNAMSGLTQCIVRKGNLSLIAWRAYDGYSRINVYDSSTSSWLYSDATIGQQYWDGHNISGVAISDDGYVYVAGGGRIDGYTTNNYKVYKSDYPLDNGSFTLAGFTDISPSAVSTPPGRGYKSMVVDQAGVLHLVTAVGNTLYLSNYNGTWSYAGQIFALTGIVTPTNSLYYDTMVLGKEASGQKSLHISMVYSDDAIDTSNSLATAGLKLLYVKYVMQVSRAYKAYKADGTEIVTLPVTHSTADVVYNGTAGSYYVRILGGIDVRLDNTPIIAHILENKTTPWAPVQLNAYAWNTSVWSSSTVTSTIDIPIPPEIRSVLQTPPVISQESDGRIYIETMNRDGNNRCQIEEHFSDDDGATWSAAEARTTDVLEGIRIALNSQLVFNKVISSTHSELRFLPRLAEPISRIYSYYQAMNRSYFY